MLHVRALFVGGGGCVWVKCLCGGSGPHPGCWVLGWCWCSLRLVWPSAAVVAVHYFALLCCTVCCVLSCAGAFHCVPLPALACCGALCATLPPRCALGCLHEVWRPQGRCPRWGRILVTSGAESEPPWPAFEACVCALFASGGGCAWVKCLCGGSSPHLGRWVLGWCRCLRQVVWLSAAIVVVQCSALFCYTVCCMLLCAGKFRYVPLPAVACYAALCAALPP